MKIDFTLTEMISFIKTFGYEVYEKEVEYTEKVYHNDIEYHTRNIFVVRSPSGYVPKIWEFTKREEMVENTFNIVFKNALLHSLTGGL